MAVASGQPPQDTKQKKEVTPEQRKTYAAIGAVGVLALIAGFMYIPGMISGGSSTDTATTATTNTVSAQPDASPVPVGAGAGTSADPAAVGGAVTAGVTTTSLNGVPLTRSRIDPFQQQYLIPTPAPTIAPPVSIPLPNPSSPVFLPGSGLSNADLQTPLNLPPVSIRRLDEASRRPVDAFPPRRSAGTGSGAGGGSGTASPSYDKRLSGVIIGDGVRALLEIQGPNGFVTRVVQPGDDVDGITVLNIQRFNDGTRTVTRMLIRENGEERTVDLRAGNNPSLTAGGAPGSEGGPGMTGMPGAPIGR